MSCRLAWATRDRQTDEECGSERKGCSVKHCGLSVKTRLLCEGDGGVWVYLLENPRYPDSLGLWRGILLPENVSYLSLPFSSLLNDYTISVTFDKTILALQTCPHLPLLATPPQAHISVREEGFFFMPEVLRDLNNNTSPGRPWRNGKYDKSLEEVFKSLDTEQAISQEDSPAGCISWEDLEDTLAVIV